MCLHPMHRRALCLSVLLFFFAVLLPLPADGDAAPPLPTSLEADILAAWSRGEARILLDTPTPLNVIEATYFSLLDRVPEYVWVADRFSYTATAAGVVALTPDYLCPPDAIDAVRTELTAAVSSLLAVMPRHGSDYARAYALHDALAAVAAYGGAAWSALGCEAAYTAYGALIDGRAVCRGYAMAYLVLLARAGIAAEYVASPTMAHGWVCAELDGRRLHIDVTWNDSGTLTHRYFARSDAAMHRMGYAGWQSKS